MRRGLSSFWFIFVMSVPSRMTEPPVTSYMRMMVRAQVDFPDLQMPRFETWHLPRGIGWQVGAALVAGYFLRSSASEGLRVAGAILYTAARSLFIIQGAALVNFMQKARGTKRTWRVIVPILLMLFSVLVFLGIFDQISNIRGLRKPRDTKEDF